MAGVTRGRGESNSSGVYSLPWYSRRAIGRSALPRHEFAAVAMDDRDVCIFGGTDGFEIKRDVVMLQDPSSGSPSWNAVSPKGGMELFPGLRGHVAVAVSPDTVLITGGQSIDGFSGQENTILLWNQGTRIWSKLAVKGAGIPTGLIYHSTSYYQGKLYVFGGITQGKTLSNSMRRIDGIASGSPKSSLIQTQRGPMPRFGHSAVVIENNKILIYGGTDGVQVFGDMWIFDADDETWTNVSPDNSTRGPGPIAGHAAVCFEVQSEMYLIGGMKPSSGQSTEGLLEQDIWAYRWKENLWFRLDKLGHDDECARYGHQVCILRDKCLVLGGRAQQDQDLFDLHMLDFTKLRAFNFVAVSCDEPTPTAIGNCPERFARLGPFSLEDSDFQTTSLNYHPISGSRQSTTSSSSDALKSTSKKENRKSRPDDRTDDVAELLADLSKAKDMIASISNMHELATAKKRSSRESIVTVTPFAAHLLAQQSLPVADTAGSSSSSPGKRESNTIPMILGMYGDESGDKEDRNRATTPAKSKKPTSIDIAPQQVSSQIINVPVTPSSATREISRLKSALAQEEQRRMEAEELLEKTKDKIITAKDAIKMQLALEKQEKEKLLNDIQEHLRIEMEAREVAERKAESLQHQLDSNTAAVSDIDMYKQRAADVEAKFRKLQADTANVLSFKETAIAELKKQKSELETKLQQLLGQVEALQKGQLQLQKRNESKAGIEESVDKLQQKLDQSNAKVSELIAERQTSIEKMIRLDGLESKAMMSEMEAKEWRQKFTALSQERDRILADSSSSSSGKAALEDIMRRAVQAESRVEELSSELANAKRRNDELDKRSRSLITAGDHDAEELSRLRQHITALTNQLTDSEQVHQIAMNDMKRQLSSVSATKSLPASVASPATVSFSNSSASAALSLVDNRKGNTTYSSSPTTNTDLSKPSVTPRKLTITKEKDAETNIKPKPIVAHSPGPQRRRLPSELEVSSLPPPPGMEIGVSPAPAQSSPGATRNISAELVPPSPTSSSLLPPPPPPPPPPSSLQSSNLGVSASPTESSMKVDLLAQIQKGTKLKHVNESESTGKGGNSSDKKATPKSSQDTLVAEMQARLQKMRR